jgi:hypothetical protein
MGRQQVNRVLTSGFKSVPFILPGTSSAGSAQGLVNTVKGLPFAQI